MNRLKELRTARGMTLAQLAKASGFGISTINNFENVLEIPDIPSEEHALRQEDRGGCRVKGGRRDRGLSG